MKSILETSVYLVVAALICYIGIDFVSLNMKISKINETTQYMQDYVEIYGEAVAQEDGSLALDESTFSAIQSKAQQNNMTISYNYLSQTNEYIYYNLEISYELTMQTLGFQKSHTSNSLVRVAI